MGTLAEAAATGYINILSTDRTHCPINEQRPWSKKWSSHKLGGDAAVKYELGILIHKDKLVWIRGPSPAGAEPDITVFRNGLKKALPAGT